MKPWARYGLAALVGAALCFAVTKRPARVVHAQSAYEPGCVTTVPKSWGNFRGVSDQGIAFEDSAGTIRVVAHPMCGNSVVDTPTLRPDLEIRRP